MKRSLANLSTVQSGMQPLRPGLSGVSARILRNGCDRLANGMTNIPTRCFPEDYFYANPQFNNGIGTILNVPIGSGPPTAWVFNLQTSCTLNALAQVVPAGTPGAFALPPSAGGAVRYALPVLQHSLPGTQGTQGARMLRLPGRWFFDANISKTFRLSETKSLQFRVDANNILNHPNPGEPNFNVNSADFGRITANKVSNAASPRSFQAQIRFAF